MVKFYIVIVGEGGARAVSGSRWWSILKWWKIGISVSNGAFTYNLNAGGGGGSGVVNYNPQNSRQVYFNYWWRRWWRSLNIIGDVIRRWWFLQVVVMVV